MSFFILNILFNIPAIWQHSRHGALGEAEASLLDFVGLGACLPHLAVSIADTSQTVCRRKPACWHWTGSSKPCSSSASYSRIRALILHPPISSHYTMILRQTRARSTKLLLKRTAISSWPSLLPTSYDCFGRELLSPLHRTTLRRRGHRCSPCATLWLSSFVAEQGVLERVWRHPDLRGGQRRGLIVKMRTRGRAPAPVGYQAVSIDYVPVASAGTASVSWRGFSPLPLHLRLRVLLTESEGKGSVPRFASSF